PDDSLVQYRKFLVDIGFEYQLDTGFSQQIQDFLRSCFVLVFKIGSRSCHNNHLNPFIQRSTYVLQHLKSTSLRYEWTNNKNLLRCIHQVVNVYGKEIAIIKNDVHGFIAKAFRLRGIAYGSISCKPFAVHFLQHSYMNIDVVV